MGYYTVDRTTLDYSAPIPLGGRGRGEGEGRGEGGGGGRRGGLGER